MKPKTINFSQLFFFSQESTGHVIYEADMYAVADTKLSVGLQTKWLTPVDSKSLGSWLKAV